MLETYIKTNSHVWPEATSSTATIVRSDVYFTTTGAPPNWANIIEATDKIIGPNFGKVLLERKKKAKFKQSKFDQIKSFGKRN